MTLRKFTAVAAAAFVIAGCAAPPADVAEPDSAEPDSTAARAPADRVPDHGNRRAPDRGPHHGHHHGGPAAAPAPPATPAPRSAAPAGPTTAPPAPRTPPAPTTTAPTTTAPRTSYANIASNVDESQWLVAPWEPNPRAGYPAFRTFCSFSHLAYHDPIVDPGNPNFAHLHMFFGNTNANQNSNYTSLRTTGNSTCDGGPLNRTAYWMPAVFNQHGNVVVPTRFELYYKAE